MFPIIQHCILNYSSSHYYLDNQLYMIIVTYSKHDQLHADFTQDTLDETETLKQLQDMEPEL